VCLGQRGVFVDEMWVGLLGQGRRYWTARWVKVRQRMERPFVWR